MDTLLQEYGFSDPDEFGRAVVGEARRQGRDTEVCPGFWGYARLDSLVEDRESGLLIGTLFSVYCSLNMGADLAEAVRRFLQG